VKILFDLQGIQNNSRERGIGRYVLNLFQSLAVRDDIDLYALLNAAMPDTLAHAYSIADMLVGAEKIFIYPGISDTKAGVDGIKALRWLSQAAYEAFIEETGCDALLAGTIVEGFEDETTVSLKNSKSSYIKAAIFYDAIPLSDIEKYIGWKPVQDWYFERIGHFKTADVVCAISDSSRREAVELLGIDPLKSVAIGTAIDKTIFHVDTPPDASWLATLHIHKPFVMLASAFDQRKNFEGLIDSYSDLPASVRANHQLVLVGGASLETRDRLRRRAEQVGIAVDELIFTGYVEDRDLARLYRACRLFVFPSFHEGFGLPALEAMSCGCATIGSSLTSVPEVIGLSDLLFNPADRAAMASIMQALLSDKDAHARAVQHAREHSSIFSWEMVAERTISALKTAFIGRLSRIQPFPSIKRMVRQISGQFDLSTVSDADLIALSRALAACEQELVGKIDASQQKTGKIWRVEGPFDYSYSLALLNRETARALSGLGYDVALYPTEGPGDFIASPVFLAANPDIAAMHALSHRTGHSDSIAVSRILYPPRVEDMAGPINALHHYAWEESGFPYEWVDNFNKHLTMMTCLSEHVRKIMIDNGVSIPLVTSGCGVDHWERITPDPKFKISARKFKFLHVSSCFPRKGADALLEAYEGKFSDHDDVTLVIKTHENPHNDIVSKLSAARERNPGFPDVLIIIEDLSEAQLKALYGQCDVMVAPSFAEGFGVPLAEAMLSGIPVITTAWGGQTDFCNTGNAWLVDYRFERAQTHFGVWSSAWARIDVSALSATMQEAFLASSQMRSEMVARGRQQLMENHSWERVTRRLSAAAASLPNISMHEPRIGLISTWQTKCGIALSSEHLVTAMESDITVFSPQNQEAISGCDQSIRSWFSSKQRSDLLRIIHLPEAIEIDVFIIQFNNTFYNHSDLAAFINAAKFLNKRIIMFLHSTVDPPEMVPVEEYHLSKMVPALVNCDRLLVHSIDDLNRLKAMGLVENVALFPLGVLMLPGSSPRRELAAVPTIGSFGFALPHKGLVEIICAIGILRQRGRPIRLRMVNAEYPAEVSRMLIIEMQLKIAELELGDLVEMHNTFLSDEECLSLLRDTDLVVFGHQSTGESASAAVRYGIAAGRPVVVTPLPIFSDLTGVTFVFEGISAAEIADGIEGALNALASNSPDAVKIAENAEKWREQHSYQRLGLRLRNLCKSLIVND